MPDNSGFWNDAWCDDWDLEAAKSKGKQKAEKVVQLNISDVTVPLGWRSIDKRKLKAIAESIKEIGLQNPITVRNRVKGMGQMYVLVSGAHRMAAAKICGEKIIQARVMEEQVSQHWTEEENILRSDLSPLDLAAIISRRSANIEHSVSKNGGRQPQNRNISDIARRFGLSRHVVSNALLHAELSEKMKVALRVSKLDRNSSFLTKIAKMPTDGERMDAIRARSKVIGKNETAKPPEPAPPRSQIKRRPNKHVDFETLKAAWLESDASSLFMNSDARVRREFLKSLES